MPDNKQSNNPYAKAASVYGQSAQKNETDQRALESRVLLKSAKMIKDLQDNWDNVNTEILQSTLKYNRQIWMLFYDNAVENYEKDRPNDLRSNIINLANFIFKKELDILAEKNRRPEQLDALININREIASGLAGNAALEDDQDQETGQTENQT